MKLVDVNKAIVIKHLLELYEIKDVLDIEIFNINDDAAQWVAIYEDDALIFLFIIEAGQICHSEELEYTKEKVAKYKGKK